MTDRVSSLDEHRLIESIKRSGDIAQFDALYRLHADAVYAVALRISGRPETAEDAAHDAWILAIERLNRFEHRSSFRTWIIGILLNRLREMWRTEFASIAIETADAEASTLVAPAHVDALDIERAIASLPPGFRTAVVLHDVEGYTHDEIASMTGTTSGTSKSQLARARIRMRELLTTSTTKEQAST